MKLRYKILFIAVALVGLSSCSDFLETIPDTRVYLQNLDQLEQLLVSGYAGNSYTVVGELSSDNVDDLNSPDANGIRYNYSPADRYHEQLYRWEDVDLSISEQNSPSAVWESYYQAIAIANAVLEVVDEIEATGEIEGNPMTPRDKARLAAVKGEAHLIRAYHHYILAQVFCMPYRGPELSKQELGIPYATKPETSLKPHYERGTLQETYDNIEKDLLIGLANVTDDYYEVPKYHFNVAAANAFAARFYLAKREYEKVVEYATASFKGNDPASMRNDFWDLSEEFYDEDEAARYYTSVERPGNYMLIDTYSTWLRAWGGRFWTHRNAATGSVYGPGPTWNQLMPCFWPHLYGSDYYGWILSPNCWEQFEYTDKLAGIGYVHMVRNEFTSQETLLFRAEANLFLGNIDAAFDDLYLWNHEHIMQRETSTNYGTMRELSKDLITGFYTLASRITPSSSAYPIVYKFHIDEVCPSDKYHVTNEIEPYLQCVQHFRRIQTAHQGQRWFDIKRYGFEIKHKWGKDEVVTLQPCDKRYAIQIPNEVIGAGLQPNPRD
ncbi:MAG: RagB/SusD family nutrient uptake outer membrane protein [Muribaculaceae bacterium]|nr:RagB/SusD family nutrient uptake outer membrane protein [Muribaculaceae bacterium]